MSSADSAQALGGGDGTAGRSKDDFCRG
eukprot:COSAG06_NODE_46504_length_346_cov_0.890688_1_plen_27_part_01